MNGEHFRKYYCYNVKTNELLKKNEKNIDLLLTNIASMTSQIDHHTTVVKNLGDSNTLLAKRIRSIEQKDKHTAQTAQVGSDQ